MKMTDNSTEPESLAYTETLDALSVRIKAHKEYSNFSLEDWLDKNVCFRKGDVILDLGCGSGNLFPVYADKIGDQGAIVGIDQNLNLLERAREVKVTSSVVLFKMDINQPLPLIRENFDHIISTFAIYYVEDQMPVLKEMKRVLKNAGEIILVGPSDNNAAELYEFNKTVFGFGRDEKAGLRTNRLEKEFYPNVSLLYEKVCLEKIPSKLIFPNKMEFVKYYMATLLFEESAIKTGMKPTLAELLSKELVSTVVSKEMIVLRGQKIV